jgi:glucose-1-phosphate cytidylyltransferase
MKIVILCGGLGTRLREETEFRPKPMVDIGGRPILWHIMKTFGHYGFNDFVLALGYKGEMIKDYFYHYELSNTAVSIKLGHPRQLRIHEPHNESGWQVTMVDTGKNALKGARLKRVEKYIKGDEFMVTYGDTIADINLRSLLAFHRSHGKLATVTGISPVSRFGELKTKGKKVESFIEKPEKSDGLINGGFLVFNRKIFNYLTEDNSCDFEKGALEEIARQGQMMVYRHDGFWACMDTMRDTEYLNELWDNNQQKWKVW